MPEVSVFFIASLPFPGRVDYIRFLDETNESFESRLYKISVDKKTESKLDYSFFREYSISGRFYLQYEK